MDTSGHNETISSHSDTQEWDGAVELTKAANNEYLSSSQQTNSRLTASHLDTCLRRLGPDRG